MVLSGSRYAALIALLLPLIYAQTTEWTVYNRTIFKDGEPFIVKGVNYAPLPPGGGVTEQTQWGDLFHADWSHLHDRDLPLMRAAGVNSLRIYNIQLNYPNSDVALDHLSFFDKLWNNGVDPIYIMITYAISKPFAYLGPFNTKPDESASSYTFQTPSPDLKWFQIDDSKEPANSLEREIQSNIVNVIAERYGTHPAVLGFVIGNEQNDLRTQANCKFWEWIDSIAARVKETAPTKLTSTSIVDDDFLTVRSALKCSSLSHLDVWGINAYRGRVDVGFDRLFTTHASLTQQALLITEYGCPASTRDQGEFVMMPMNSQDQGRYLKVHWDDMMAHGDICSGGYAFSWVDEWWKIGDWGVQNRDDARNYAFPGTYADEEAFGLLAVDVDCDSLGQWQTRKDNVIPRAAYYYMALMFGVYDEIPDVAFEPITYPLCDGSWISNGTNPDIGIPVAQQGPVSHVPLTSPPPRPVPIPVPVAAPVAAPIVAPVTQQTPQPVVVPPVAVEAPQVTPVSASVPVRDTPSTVVTPVSGTNNNIVSSSTALVASSSLIVAAVFALL